MELIGIFLSIRVKEIMFDVFIFAGVIFSR